MSEIVSETKFTPDTLKAFWERIFAANWRRSDISDEHFDLAHTAMAAWRCGERYHFQDAMLKARGDSNV